MAGTHLSGWWNQLSQPHRGVLSCLAESCDQSCVSAGAALQADGSEGLALLLVEERQADRAHRGGGPHHRPHHHPAGRRCDPHQRPHSSPASRQPDVQSAVNTLRHAHSVHTAELGLRFYLILEFSGRKTSF